MEASPLMVAISLPMAMPLASTSLMVVLLLMVVPSPHLELKAMVLLPIHGTKPLVTLLSTAVLLQPQAMEMAYMVAGISSSMVAILVQTVTAVAS